ncbi:MAG: PASTA domain-containing protein [Collinsella sp.]
MGVGGAETARDERRHPGHGAPRRRCWPWLHRRRPRCAARPRPRAARNGYEEPKKGNGGKDRRHRDRRHRGNRRRCLLCQQPVRRFREMVIVPNVIDYTQEEAEDALKNAGFNVEYGKAVNDDEVEEGRVVDQTPDGNKGGARRAPQSR